MTPKQQLEYLSETHPHMDDEGIKEQLLNDIDKIEAVIEALEERMR